MGRQSFDQTGGLKEQVGFLLVVTVSLSVVLFLGLGAMFQSWLAAKQATYQMLIDKINQQSNKIDDQNEKIKELKDKIDSYLSF